MLDPLTPDSFDSKTIFYYKYLVDQKTKDFQSMAVIEAENPDMWMYHFRQGACAKTFVRGRVGY